MLAQVRLMSPKEAMKLTSLSYQSMIRMAKRGEFPETIRLSPMRVAYRSDEIEAWVQKQLASKAS